MSTIKSPFRVALSADYIAPSGAFRSPDLGLSILDQHPSVEYAILPEFHSVTQPEQLAGFHGYITMDAGVDANSVSDADQLLVVGRFGMGYDDIDVPACTAANVAVFNCPGSVNRSMAEATLAWIFALSYKVRSKDLQVRAGDWHQGPPANLGRELRGRVFGSVGFGGISRTVHALLRPLGVDRQLTYDPYVTAEIAAELGVEKVSLDQLMRESDFVSVHCPRSPETIDLIGSRELALMKPTAYILNTARGGIINEAALFEALSAGSIAGAALDSFVGEPFEEPHRFSVLDNVLLAPHTIGHTDGLFRDIGQVACRNLVEIVEGRAPKGLLNPEVLNRPGFRQKRESLSLPPQTTAG